MMDLVLLVILAAALPVIAVAGIAVAVIYGLVSLGVWIIERREESAGDTSAS